MISKKLIFLLVKVVQFICAGINTDTLDDNQDGIKEAKEILKAQGASYKNLTFDSDSTVGKYAGNTNNPPHPW